MSAETMGSLLTPESVRVLRNAGGRTVHAGGLWGAAKSMFAAQTALDAQTPLVFLAATNSEAEQIAEDLAVFLPEYKTLTYPAWGVLPDHVMPPSEDIMSERMAVLERLLFRCSDDELYAIVLPVRALMHRVASPDMLRRSVVRIDCGDTWDMTELVEHLTKLDYERVPSVERRGEISIRGGILDVFPISGRLPYRAEFFGDTIDTIRLFDPSTQRSIEPADGFSVLPGHEREFMQELFRKKHAVAGFWKYLPEHFTLVRDEPESIVEQAGIMEHEAKGSASVVGYETAMKGLFDRADRDITVSAVLSVDNNEVSLRVPTKSMVSWAGDTGLFWEKLAEWQNNKYRVTVVCHGSGERDRLAELLAEHKWLVDEPENAKWLNLEIGAIRPGFESDDAKTVILSGCEIFGRAYRRRKRARKAMPEGAPIVAFTDLEPGDYVVHIQHGIGQYRGLRRFEGKHGEFLTLGYHGGDVLYVPVTRIDTVQKYVGADGTVPAMNRLGGTAWERTKKKVARAIQEMTGELVALYATRMKDNGYACGPDTPWQREFEDSFEYQETADQQRAIDVAKRDMESHRPMDRLVCGDVGFGKTEVALRTAFKSVVEGKQVAILVPTTVLAQQHYTTFCERVAGFPVIVEMMSRFRTQSQQRKTIARLATGGVDMVVGTHRLLSKDVKFKDLGLVIVDEEQRFGVAQKEQLKKLRHTVDVLTMTATPIPRTLQMALAGLRDMSAITTPPRDRLSIDTTVCRFSREVVREAISRELRRQGQVYFIHNRIQTIHAVAEVVRELVPDARIAVGHGQLRERELERIMIDFLDRKIDVLVSTTIVESGLDMQNVNTIVIDRADCYGLADLYQLRGRVGRHKRQAYAYLLVPSKHSLREDAMKRLRILEDCSELGSGFQIAMRDLEIRGAGNMLGPQQHGQIAAVGFEMYCELVETAAREIKGDSVEKVPLAIADLGIDAYLPDEYVPETAQKVQLYKLIATALDDKTVTSLTEELRDRFGPLPEPVSNLLAIMRSRILAGTLGADHVERTGDTVEMTFPRERYPSLEVVGALNETYHRRAEFDMGRVPRIRLSMKGIQESDMADETVKMLRTAVGAC